MTMLKPLFSLWPGPVGAGVWRCGLVLGTALGLGCNAAIALPVNGGKVIAQQVVDVTPRVNSSGVASDSSISGVFDNDGRGTVDARTVRLFLNGQEVTAQSTITSSFFSYKPTQALSPGNYQVRLDYKTLQGEQRSVTWPFTVASQSRISLDAVTHNAANPLGAGTTFLATLTGTGGAQASVLLVEAGKSPRLLPAQEVSPGVYVATLGVTSNSRLAAGAVMGRLQRGDQIAYGVASTPAILQGSATASPPAASIPPVAKQPPVSNLTAPLAPQLTRPAPGDRVTTAGFTLVGQTSPNATVSIKVTASTAIFGLVSLGGERLVDDSVTADAQGRFEIQVPSPTILQRDTRYDLVMEASLNGQTSAPVEVQLKQR